MMDFDVQIEARVHPITRIDNQLQSQFRPRNIARWASRRAIVMSQFGSEKQGGWRCERAACQIIDGHR